MTCVSYVHCTQLLAINISCNWDYRSARGNQLGLKQTWFKKFPVNEIAMTSDGCRKTSLSPSEGFILMQPRQFSLKMQREQLLPFGLTKTYSKMTPFNGLMGSRTWWSAAPVTQFASVMSDGWPKVATWLLPCGDPSLLSRRLTTDRTKVRRRGFDLPTCRLKDNTTVTASSKIIM